MVLPGASPSMSTTDRCERLDRPWPISQCAVEERSAYDLGFKDQFDIVFSIGVIHHLEYPEKALAAMTDAAKPGGKVLIWVYGLENNRWLVNMLNPLRRVLLQPAAHRHCSSPLAIPDSGAVAGAAVGIWADRVLSSFCGVWIFPTYARSCSTRCCPGSPITGRAETVLALMRQAGLADVSLIWVNEMSWSAMGTKALSG